jgi:hypothetical protein
MVKLLLTQEGQSICDFGKGQGALYMPVVFNDWEALPMR